MRTPLPKTSEPAARAFAEAGIRSLEDLTNWNERMLLSLHGVGPTSVRILRAALAETDSTFA